MDEELYEMQKWEDLPSKNTPIKSERLLHIENGVFENSKSIKEAINKLSDPVNYDSIENKPSINGRELSGDSSLADIGVTEYVDAKIKELEDAILGGAS